MTENHPTTEELEAAPLGSLLRIQNRQGNPDGTVLAIKADTEDMTWTLTRPHVAHFDAWRDAEAMAAFLADEFMPGGVALVLPADRVPAAEVGEVELATGEEPDPLAEWLEATESGSLVARVAGMTIAEVRALRLQIVQSVRRHGHERDVHQALVHALDKLHRRIQTAAETYPAPEASDLPPF